LTDCLFVVFGLYTVLLSPNQEEVEGCALISREIFCLRCYQGKAPVYLRSVNFLKVVIQPSN